MNGYKNYCRKTSDRPIILCPCPSPKKLLTSSNWISRNDSSNVNAILQPAKYLFSPRLKYNEKTKGDVVAKHILTRNNCYCRCKGKTFLRPTLFKRPNSCVSHEAVLKTNETVNYEGDLKRKSLVECVCNRVDDGDSHENDPEPLKAKLTRLKQSRSLPVEVDLEYSDQRKEYEEYRQIEEEKFQEILQEFDDNDQLRAGDCNTVDTILGTQKFGITTSSSGFECIGSSVPMQNQEELTDDMATDNFPVYSEWSVPDFRREHYFETHNIGKLDKMTGDVTKDEHTCVHQFQLNNRWLPEPLNKDAFGRSICKTCEKPMDESSINLSKGHLMGDGMNKSRIKNYAESYKNGFSPTTINLGRGKSNIEVILKDIDVNRLSSYVNKTKKPVYCNSLALRHQKMRLI